MVQEVTSLTCPEVIDLLALLLGLDLLLLLVELFSPGLGLVGVVVVEEAAPSRGHGGFLGLLTLFAFS